MQNFSLRPLSSSDKTLNHFFLLQSPDCSDRARRRRRDTANQDTNEEGHPATIEVYSGLYVNEDAEIIEGNDDSVFAVKVSLVNENFYFSFLLISHFYFLFLYHQFQRPEDALCISQRNFAIAISIAGLILMLLVVAAVICIMARRRHKTVSNSGSSIYSGPYTNTAFSHSS